MRDLHAGAGEASTVVYIQVAAVDVEISQFQVQGRGGLHGRAVRMALDDKLAVLEIDPIQYAVASVKDANPPVLCLDSSYRHAGRIGDQQAIVLAIPRA